MLAADPSTPNTPQLFRAKTLLPSSAGVAFPPR